MSNNDARKYELMVIVDPDLGTDAIKKRIDRLKKQLSGMGGEIFHHEITGEKILGYKMRSKVSGYRTNGYYAHFDFTADPDQIAEFDLGLKLEPEIIRHLLVKLPIGFEPGKTIQFAEETEK